MMGFEIGFLFFAGIISGVVGLVLGSVVGKAVAGFLLGAFLGPIGWVIVFLLPRTAEEEQTSSHHQAQPVKPVPSPSVKRDLDSDAYKLYLGKKYEIQRNDLFQKFECKEKFFESLEDALVFADEIEKDQVEEQRKGLARKLNWITIRDNLAGSGITVDRTAPLFGDSVYSVVDGDDKLEFSTLEQLQDYYINKV